MYVYRVYDRRGNLLWELPDGTPGRWDFTLPGPAQGGRIAREWKDEK